MNRIGQVWIQYEYIIVDHIMQRVVLITNTDTHIIAPSVAHQVYTLDFNSKLWKRVA